VDLTGATARFTIKDHAGGTVIADVTAGMVIDNTAKTISVTLGADVTAAIAAKRGEFECWVKVGANVKQLEVGDVTFEPGVAL
jgi:hypothetical protein